MHVNGCVIKIFSQLNLAIWLPTDFNRMLTSPGLCLNQILLSAETVSLTLKKHLKKYMFNIISLSKSISLM